MQYVRVVESDYAVIAHVLAVQIVKVVLRVQVHPVSTGTSRSSYMWHNNISVGSTLSTAAWPACS